jgi:hypothetical protein
MIYFSGLSDHADAGGIVGVLRKHPSGSFEYFFPGRLFG